MSIRFITLLSLLAATTVVSCNVKSASSKTESFKVWGNCDMCKKTIEQAAEKEGVSKASWNTQSGLMTVTYDTVQTNLKAIQQNIAASGYDNEVFKGNDAAYATLPECCHYDRKK